jgi:hypothetical protein
MVSWLALQIIQGSGRGTARAEDSEGTPTQRHTSPSMPVYRNQRPSSPPIQLGQGAWSYHYTLLYLNTTRAFSGVRQRRAGLGGAQPSRALSSLQASSHAPIHHHYTTLSSISHHYTTLSPTLHDPFPNQTSFHNPFSNITPPFSGVRQRRAGLGGAQPPGALSPLQAGTSPHKALHGYLAHKKQPPPPRTTI